MEGEAKQMNCLSRRIPCHVIRRRKWKICRLPSYIYTYPHLPLFSVIRGRRKSVATLGNRLPRRWDKRVEADVMIYIYQRRSILDAKGYRSKRRRGRGWPAGARGIEAGKGEWDGPNVMHECMTDDGKRRNGQFF